jgi:hypothetical protein
MNLDIVAERTVWGLDRIFVSLIYCVIIKLYYKSSASILPSVTSIVARRGFIPVAIITPYLAGKQLFPNPSGVTCHGFHVRSAFFSLACLLMAFFKRKPSASRRQK